VPNIGKRKQTTQFFTIFRPQRFEELTRYNFVAIGIFKVIFMHHELVFSGRKRIFQWRVAEGNYSWYIDLQKYEILLIETEEAWSP
jgi:hypothetical protein